jgi:zinc protease
MRAFAIACLMCAAAVAAAAGFEQSGIADWTKPPAPTAEPAFAPPVAKRLALANGMALLVIENHALPIYAAELVVPGAGAAADPAGKAGLAAFTADLLDEGAGGLSALQISDEEERLGTEIGLFANEDAAYVSLHGLTKTLHPALALLGKIVVQPTFDSSEFDRVRGDRVTSLELRRDRPREVANLVLQAALYGPATAYGHPTNGAREELPKLTVGDAQQFYRTHWNPKGMTLVVAGDIDTLALKAELDASLGAWTAPGAIPPPRPVATPQPLVHRMLLVDRPGAAQSDVRFGLVGPAHNDKRYYAFEVFASTLGGGFTSRLVQRLREQLGITYGAGAGMDWRVARGPFVISTAIQTPSTAQGIAETLKLVADLAEHDVPAAELDKSKQNLIRALPAMFETNAATAGAFAELALLGLPDNFYAHQAEAIRKVTAAEVRAAAKELVPAGKLAIAIVGDMTKVRAELDKLALGEPAVFDAYGLPSGNASGK